tara:strand:+ start:2672 stop:2986 length:315 start_codon:yes stop_codon:yes gene_type:complete
VTAFYEKAVFRVPDTARFLWQHWDDAYVIYDTRSGHTQAMNELAREVLAIIEDHPCSLGDILRELENIMGQPLSAALGQQILDTLKEFDKMGLIEPVRQPTGRE